MTCRATLAIAVLLAGCTEDIPEIDVTGTALTPVTIGSIADPIPQSLAHYRWELLAAPAHSNTRAPTEDAPSIVVTPPVRGIYAYERWIDDGISEQVSLRAVLTVAGMPPVAVLPSAPHTTVGTRVPLDAGASYSAEHLPLTFAWRLARHPAGSTAAIVDAKAVMLTLTPDVPGDYEIELRVFDGDLWSNMVSQTVNVTRD